MRLPPAPSGPCASHAPLQPPRKFPSPYSHPMHTLAKASSQPQHLPVLGAPGQGGAITRHIHLAARSRRGREGGKGRSVPSCAGGLSKYSDRDAKQLLQPARPRRPAAPTCRGDWRGAIAAPPGRLEALQGQSSARLRGLRISGRLVCALSPSCGSPG